MPFRFRYLRLKLQVLVVTIIFLGLIAGSEADRTCHKCDGGPDCDNPPRNPVHSVICLSPFDGCFKSGVPGAIKRFCYSLTKGRCIISALRDFYRDEDANCYNAIVHEKLNGKIERCIKEYGLWGGDTPDLPSAANGTVCVCIDQSYCNEGPVELKLNGHENGTTEAPGPTNVFSKQHKTFPAGRATSNSKMISGSLKFLTIAAIYNYSKGSTSS